jgi:ankyrin repeat protein
VVLRDPLLLWSAERGLLPAARLFEVLGGELDREEPASLARFAARGDVRRIKAMIALGAPVAAGDGHGKTPLHFAAEAGEAGAIALLLDAGADPNAAANGGVTPLMAAVARGHVEATRLLLEAGAVADARDAEGMTVLMHACSWRGKTEIVQALLAAGADRNARDRKGRSAADRTRVWNRADLERLVRPVETPAATP